MTTITPGSLAPEIVALAQRVVPNSQPVIIRLEPGLGFRPDHCNMNVRAMLLKYGGEAVFGWSFYIWPSLYAEAFQHVVWRDQKGILHDVTPCVDGQSTRMFIPDSSFTIDDLWTAPMMTCKFIAISNSPTVGRYIAAREQHARFRERAYTPVGGGQFTALSTVQQIEPMLMNEINKAMQDLLIHARGSH